MSTRSHSRLGRLAVIIALGAGLVGFTPGVASATTPANRSSAPPVAVFTAAAYSSSLPPPQYLKGVDGATKIVEVVGAGAGSMYATMALWQRQSDGSWALQTNPFPVYVGENGWAWPSQRHEGGLQTPIGSYAFGTGFGWSPNPGYGGPWLNVAPNGNPLGNPDTYWNESPNTPGYNTPSSTPTYPWNEDLTTTPQYDQAALINYNTPGPGQVQGQGSGIFVHDDPAGYTYTAGCVGVPNGMIDTVLRFIDTSDTRIIMGPAGDISTPPPLVVGMASTPHGDGYWTVNAAGYVDAYGSADLYGSMGGQHLNAPISHIVSTPSGKGYWLVAADGGVFSFGDAQFYGSMGGKPLNAPVMDIIPTANGAGYWLVATDGGVFSFGDAQFAGSMGGHPLNAPVNGGSPSQGGYWLVASDGGIFAFGGAQFYGSTGGKALNAPIVGMADTPGGQGYWLVASDGGVFTFGDAQFYGSTGGSAPSTPVVGMAVDPGTGGYWIVDQAGQIFNFNAPIYAA